MLVAETIRTSALQNIWERKMDRRFPYELTCRVGGATYIVLHLTVITLKGRKSDRAGPSTMVGPIDWGAWALSTKTDPPPPRRVVKRQV